MSSADESARRAQEDADFQRIIEGFGETPEFPELPSASSPESEQPAQEPTELVPAELAENTSLDNDRFVPPIPPPVPRPRGIRGVAWFGLFGVPTLVLVAVVLSIPLPSPVTLLLLAWFVGGFGYLVATMGAGPSADSGWDDGAAL